MLDQQLQTLKLKTLAKVTEEYPDSNFRVKVEIEEESEILIFINWMDDPTWDQVKKLTQAIENAEKGRFIFPQRSYSDRPPSRRPCKAAFCVVGIAHYK